MSRDGRGRAGRPPGLAVLAALAATVGCKGDGKDRSAVEQPPPTQTRDAAVAPAPAELPLPPAPPVPRVPTGLPEPGRGPSGPRAGARVVLGELLFGDRRLAANNALSCADCHDPAKNFADGKPRAKTISDKLNLRHTPTLANLVYQKYYFWDGSADDLDDAIRAHWRGQMLGDTGTEAVAAKLAADPEYRGHFRRSFQRGPNAAAVRSALAAFLETRFSGDSPWDRYEAGDRQAVSSDVIAGFAIFSEKAQCALCHPPPLYSDGDFHDIGVGALGPDGELLDIGRARVSGVATDRGAFKTPSLRSIALSGPYFHDGSAKTLRDTLEHGLRAAATRAAPGSIPGRLSDDETRQLLSFLAALTPARAP